MIYAGKNTVLITVCNVCSDPHTSGFEFSVCIHYVTGQLIKKQTIPGISQIAGENAYFGNYRLKLIYLT